MEPEYEGRKKCCCSDGGVESMVEGIGSVVTVSELRLFTRVALAVGNGSSRCNRGMIGDGGFPGAAVPSTWSVSHLAMRGLCGVTNPACNAGSSYRFQKKSMV